jgi:4-hydroxybenzoate polyprenyltransferase
VFTAIADIAMGYVVATQSLRPWPVFACLCLATSLMYLAGMILNDLYDVEVDRVERPQRPLPSGAIRLSTARWMGYGFLLSGCALGGLAGWLHHSLFAPPDGQTGLMWRSGLFGMMLAISVVAYDRFLKKTPLGPLAMGACRFFNVLLGMSMAEQTDGPAWACYLTAPFLVIAGGIGVYIAGVTLFAKTEAKASKRWMLAAGLAVMVAGLAMLASLAYFDTGKLPFRPPVQAQMLWPGMLLLVSLSIFRVAIMAVVDPKPQRVQAAVKQSLLTLIILDACVCMLAASQQPWYAIGVCALLAPMLWLGRWIYST